MKPKMRAILLLSLAATSAESQTLSASERKMREWIQTHTAEQTAFLEKVVNINSGTFNLAGVKAVGDEFAREFKALGFETRWIPLPAEMKRAGHLFAEHRAKKRSRNTGKTLLLIGHLDTVFELYLERPRQHQPVQTSSLSGRTADRS